MTAHHRSNGGFGALLMRCWNAVTVWSSAVFRHYHRAGALLPFNSLCIAKDLPFQPSESGIRSAGRMCEVGPPASGRSFFTSLIRAGGTQRASRPAGPAAAAAYGVGHE